jgi:hypothetical protein
MSLKPPKVKASPSKPPPPGDRGWVGCCNRRVCQTIQRNAAVAKAKKDLVIQQKKEQAELEKNGDSGQNKAKLFGAFGSSSSSNNEAGGEKDEWTLVNSSSNNSLDGSGGGGVKKSGSNSNIAGLQNTLGEVGANLEERGEKLNSLAQKSEALDNVRPCYAMLCYALLCFAMLSLSMSIVLAFCC